MNQDIQLSLTEKLEKESQLIEEKLLHVSAYDTIKTDEEIEQAFMEEMNKLNLFLKKENGTDISTS